MKVIKDSRVSIERFRSEMDVYLDGVELGDVVEVTRLGTVVAVLVPLDTYRAMKEVEEASGGADFGSIESQLDDLSADLSSIRHDLRRIEREAKKK